MPVPIVTPPALICTSLASPPDVPNSHYVLIAFSDQAAGWSASSADAWITVGSPSEETGYVQWQIRCEDNTGDTRSGLIVVEGSGFRQSIPVTQFGAYSVEYQADMVLNPPPNTERAKFPLAMELGCLGKFVGEEIAKLPPEVQPVVLALVLAIIPVLAAIAIAGREAFVSVPDPPDFFRPSLPMTVELITQQAGLLAAYIPEVVLENE